MRKVSAIEVAPRTVHWNNRLSFGAETTNSAEVRRRCLDLNGHMFVKPKLAPREDLVDNAGRVRPLLLPQ